jgi:hypothetical protein
MKTIELIFEVIDELNLDLDLGNQIIKNPSTPILGSNSTIDSILLINFIYLVEEKINLKTGKTISISDDRAMSMKESPFLTLSSLSSYVDLLINE